MGYRAEIKEGRAWIYVPPGLYPVFELWDMLEDGTSRYVVTLQPDSQRGNAPNTEEPHEPGNHSARHAASLREALAGLQKAININRLDSRMGIITALAEAVPTGIGEPEYAHAQLCGFFSAHAGMVIREAELLIDAIERDAKEREEA